MLCDLDLAALMSLHNKKILVICGPTWVPIDEMRVISNRSTGKLGHLLAKSFQRSGAKVTLLEGPCTDIYTAKNVTVRKFFYYNELVSLLKTELKNNFDVIVHAAAISDYRLKNLYRGKLRSGLSKVKLILVPTQKIINEIRRLAPRAVLVGFKLEPTPSLVALKKRGMGLIQKAECDFVVANSLTPQYRGYIMNGLGEVLSSVSSRPELATKLVRILNDHKQAG